MLDAVDGDEFGSNDRLVVNYVGNGSVIGRRIPEDGLSCHDTIGVETDESVVAGHGHCLSEERSSFEMSSQILPGSHLGIGELAGLSGLLTAYRSSYDVRGLVAQAFRALGRSESLCGLPMQSLAAKGGNERVSSAAVEPQRRQPIIIILLLCPSALLSLKTIVTL